jgi:four helix bundle protein
MEMFKTFKSRKTLERFTNWTLEQVELNSAIEHQQRGARAMMKFKFEELEVWHLSLELINEVYDLLGNYPNDERFDLVRQGRRSVTSISLNISEGSIRSKREFRQFLRISLGSLVETVGNLKIGVHRKYITQEDLESVQSIEPLYFKLIKLRKSL